MGMEINIDFLVSGCNTRCLHCYVNGGPDSMMDIVDVLLCLDKLNELGEYFQENISFTLDNEPMNHPQIDKILDIASKKSNIVNFHHGMTTGIGLMNRKDKERVVDAYFRNGYRTFGSTFHGVGSNHDEIVRRFGAYGKSISAIKFLKERGARIEVSLMFNRYFSGDVQEIQVMINKLNPNRVDLVIPIFTPHRNMMNFEPYRGNLEDLEKYLSIWDSGRLFNQIEYYTPLAIIEQLERGLKLKELFQREQRELYLSLHQDCNLYVGNTGSETLLLGDLRKLEIKSLVGKIKSLSGNRDYTAFYDLKLLPNEEELIKALKAISQENVYGDMESVIYRGLAELNIPTKII